MNSLTLLQKGLLVISLPLLFELILIAGLGLVIAKTDRDSRIADTSTAKLASVDEISQKFVEAGLTLVLYGVTRSEIIEARFESALDRIRENLKQMDTLFKGAPDQEDILAECRSKCNLGLQLTGQIKKELSRGQIYDLSIFKTDNPKRQECFSTISTINQLLSRLTASEKTLRKQISSSFEKSEYELKLILVTGLGINIIMAVITAGIYKLNLVSRLERIIENCNRFSRNEELLPAVSGGDEIAAVDREIRVMADAISEAARRERAMVEDAADIIISIDENGKILTANRAAAAVWQRQGESPVGLKVYDLISPDSVQSLAQSVDSCRSGRAVCEADIVNAEGGVLHTRWTMSASPENKNLYCIIRDITVEKETEELKSHFVSMVTHDLRTPLTSINNLLSMLEAGGYGTLNQEQKDGAIAARMISDRLIKTISDYLDLEKIHAGAFNIHKEPTDISSVLSYIIEEKQLETVTLSDRTRGVSVLADSDLLTTGLGDLIGAAASQSKSTGIELQDSGDAVTITIESAIKPEYSLALTSPFEFIFSMEAGILHESFDVLLSLNRLGAIVRLHSGNLSVSPDNSLVSISIPQERIT